MDVSANTFAKMLERDPEDEDLLRALEGVCSCPRMYIDLLVGSRKKADKVELERILMHLPMVRETKGSSRGDAHKPGTAGSGQKASRIGSLQLAAEGALAPGGSMSAREVNGASYVPVAKPSSRLTTPRVGTAGVALPAAAAATPRLTTPRLTTPRIGTGLGTQRVGATPRESLQQRECGVPSKVDGPSNPIAEAPAAPPRRTQTAKSDESEKRKAAWELKMEQAVKETSARCADRLAEYGIDTTEHSAAEILQLMYARSGGSSYTLFNREAAARCNVRVQTPQSFSGVLNERARTEIRRARDMPVENVHECLDKWEIDFLADVCRSLRHFGEKNQGHMSEYNRMSRAIKPRDMFVKIKRDEL